MIDLFVIDDFFDAATREAVFAEVRSSAGAPATIYGGAAAVETRVRKTTRVAASPALQQLVMTMTLARKHEIEQHFAVELSECEEPQFLRYEPGDFFVAHQDGNTPLIRQTQKRIISTVIFLSEPSDYEGGSLVFHGDYRDPYFRQTAPAAPGTLLAFRAQTTHEVTPVVRGERFTIAGWLR